MINKTFPIWHGTKGCKKKHLKTPQWLRNQKIKKKTFLNFFNIDESRREIKKYCDLSISSLKIFGPVPETLLGLVNFIREREF